MPTANEELRDLIVGRQVAIQRLSRKHQIELIRILKRSLKLAQDTLRDRLATIAATGIDTGPYTTAQVQRAVYVIGEILAQAYADMGDVAALRMLDAVRSEAAISARLVTQALPAGVALDLAVPSMELLETIARRAAVQGGPLGSYFARTGKRSLWKRTLLKYRREIEDAAAEGLLVGESVDQVTRRIGRNVERLASWQLRSVVDTATKQISADSRMAFWQANAGENGVVKGYQWLSTLDLHTTKEYCIPRDGKAYDLDLQPIGHGYEWGAGPGAIHWGCRSGSTAILKSWEELGIDADEITDATRASMDGQIARETNALQWMKNRDWNKAELADVFGAKKAQRILDGDLTVAGALRGYGVRVPN